MYSIHPYSDLPHRRQVVQLWTDTFGYDAPHNTPSLAIDTKLAVQDALFFVALFDCAVVGTILAGYDGHRGWLYSVAVSPQHRGNGLGARLVAHGEAALTRLGCVKINLQIAEGNEKAVGF